MNSLKTIIVALLAVCAGQISATHIVGGEMTYQYQGNNKYKINLSVFIDCINGQPGAIEQDATAVIGVYDGVNGRILNGYPVIVGRNGPLRVTKVNYNCISTTPNACVDHYWYETTLTLPPRTGGYYVSFQRCCRNNSISNLVNPGGTGANYWTLIPDPRTLPDGKPNSSAVFKELPPNFLCTNTILKFDHSAKDADGDSLVYDLFLPFRGATQNAPRPDNNGSGTLASPPFPNITFGSSYDELNPIDGNPPLTIDPETGFLSLVPTVEGQFVVGIRVREYRKGVLIGETKRDYQFNVRSCVIDMVAAYFSPKYICGYSYKFQNKSQGATRYHWDFGIAGTDSDTSNQYQPTAIFPAAGKYRVVLTTYKNNCIDSFAQDVIVVEPSKPKLPKDTTICPASTAQYYSDITAESYRWSTGATTRGIVVRKEGKYWLEITIKTCKWRDTVEVKEDKDSIQAFGDTVYCTYDTFRRRLFASPGLFKYSWSNGSKLDRTFVTSQGQYVVSAVTALGCASSDTATVEHYPPVEVVIPDTTICPYNSVRFDAKNPGATIEWSNGDVGRYSTITTPNTYQVKVTIGKCRDFDTFTLSNYPFEFALGNDLRFCSTIDTPLTVDGSKFSNVVWNKEVTGPKFRLLNPGKLVVNVTN
ncbi:MAG: hypothetical protein IT244_06345, partial [Bacteroidia bacterium]|nr:hypothetical protein [Bacteroidia bacterium]